MTPELPQSPDVTTPTQCPACQSRKITTTARNPNEHSYWRCDSCGEVWNVARRKIAQPRLRSWR
jgi:transposase-like protein